MVQDGDLDPVLPQPRSQLPGYPVVPSPDAARHDRDPGSLRT